MPVPVASWVYRWKTGAKAKNACSVFAWVEAIGHELGMVEIIPGKIVIYKGL